jgi:hypothetical protein
MGAVLGFTIAVTMVAIRNRRARKRPKTAIEEIQDAPSVPVDDDGATDFVQFWMDNEWDQRFG